MTPPNNQARDFRVYLWSVWRRRWVVLGLLLVIPAVSYALEARKQTQYSSSALVRPDVGAIDPSLLPASPAGDEPLLAVARLVQTRGIANAAGKLLRPPVPGASISGLIAVAPDTDTGFLTISARSPDPRRAARVANAFASAISDNREAQRTGQIDAAVNGLKRQLRALPSDHAQRAGINEQIQKLRTLRSTLHPGQGVVERAVPSTTPVGRNTRRAIELGLLLAILLSAGIVAVAESSDRLLRSPDELEALTGLPLLSAIPTSAFGSRDGDVRDDEAFNMLRAALTYFNADRKLKSVLIASPGQEDGKTTVAVRLAHMQARAGSRVILVDADLRQPRIAPRLGLAPSDGLAAVLGGTLRLPDALVDVPLQQPGEPAMPLQGALKLLPAGSAAPNPAELLSSPELPGVLRALEAHADYVVIDSAAALAVSDTLPLLPAVSGVVLVARINRSTKHGVRRLQQVVDAAKGTLVGVVATGASPRAGYGYGYAAPNEWRAAARQDPANAQATEVVARQRTSHT